MNRFVKWSLIAIFVVLVAGCLGFYWANLHALLWAEPTPLKVEGAEDVNRIDQALVDQLQQAPWQGLRFMREERIWRFYGVAGETRQIDLIQPIRLVKVYYLDGKGDLRFTWAATEIQFPGKPAYLLTAQPVQEGQLIAVQLQGDYVTRQGVFWEDCPSDYYHLAQRIDSVLVLDEQGTGISNGFIRYGWQPPSHPFYGFLCWQIDTVENIPETFVSVNEGE